MATESCPGGGRSVEPYTVAGLAAWGKCPECDERFQMESKKRGQGQWHWHLPKHERKVT